MATMLTCKQCGHENESERIYCHNCGAKLDRTLLPQQEKSRETNEKRRKRVMRMTKPSRGFFAGWMSSAAGVLIGAIAVAACIQAIRPPAAIPLEGKKGELEDVPPIAMALEREMSEVVPKQVVISEDVANRYLRYTLRGQSQGPLGESLKFERAFVAFHPGVCQITTQQSLFNHPLYASSRYQLKIEGGKLVVTNGGGSIGRLPLHPKIMEQTDVFLRKLWDALERERKLIESMAGVEITEGQIKLVTKGAAPARP